MRFVARIVNRAATIVLVVALLALGALAVTVLLGLKPGVVKTGSMEPMLARGTLIVVKPTMADKLKIGDVITFTDPDNPSKGLVTHRIYKIEQVDGRPVFTTKGDANPTPDTWKLKLQKDAGLLKFHVKKVGYLSFLVRSKTGYLLFLGIPVLLLSLVAMMKIWAPPKDEPEPQVEAGRAPETAAFGTPPQIDARPTAVAPPPAAVAPPPAAESFGYPTEAPETMPVAPNSTAPPGSDEKAESA
ncbi:MAG: signal peptidase I [Actinobacteria bacterium]|nr:signal peptidase I [Actinomycetota bacterium]